jgi:predicted DNA-binding WGR domain protein
VNVRRFESAGEPRRFWEIDLRWNAYVERAGDAGASGEPRTRTFPDAASAARAVEALIAERTAAGAGVRRFEIVGGGSKKFWEVSVTGTEYTVRFGRIGTQGQTKSKTFPDAASAVREAAKLVAEKTKKGYVEKAGGAAASGADSDDDAEDAGDEE